MRVVLTSHARRQLTERRLSEDLVRDVVLQPDRVMERPDATLTAQKTVIWKGRTVLCRVIYRVEQGETAHVITAYVTTKFEKYGASP